MLTDYNRLNYTKRATKIKYNAKNWFYQES